MNTLDTQKTNRISEVLRKTFNYCGYSQDKADNIIYNLLINLHEDENGYDTRDKLNKAFQRSYLTFCAAGEIINTFNWRLSPQGREYWEELHLEVLSFEESYERTTKHEWKQIAYGEDTSAFYSEEGKTLTQWIATFEQPISSQLMYRFIELRNKNNGYDKEVHLEYCDESLYNYISEIKSSLNLSSSVQGSNYWNHVFAKYEALRYFLAEKREEERTERIRQEREAERLREEANRVTFSDSFRKMLRDIMNSSRVAEILLNNQYHSRDFGNYITMRGELASYLPNGREHKVNDFGRWARDGRQDSKVGKLAKKLINEKGLQYLTDSDFEKFTNVVKSYISVIGDEDGEGKKLEFKVVSGEDIRTYYHEDNYSKILGTDTNLWGSCMRYESCQSYLNIYVKNSSVCSMLVALDTNGKVLGRALLWVSTDGAKLMDTIYAAESLQSAFKKYANDNEYWYKSSQSCHHETFDMFNGEENNKYETISVKLERGDFARYPYLDTMKYLDGTTLTNEEDSDYKKLVSTDGLYEGAGQVYSEWHEDSIDEDDAVYLDYHRPNGRHLESYVLVGECVGTRSGWRFSRGMS